MTPELLAMIKDVKPASDEEISDALDWLKQYPTAGRYECAVEDILSLIARILAERKEWQDISTAPHACTFLATYWDTDYCEWSVGIVMRPLSGRWTHWQPLPTPPAIQSGETSND